MGREARIRKQRRQMESTRDNNASIEHISLPPLPGGAREYESPDEIPGELREALYCHEILRKTQYSAAQIFITIKQGSVIVVVRDRGGKSAGLVVADTTIPEDDLAKLWPGAVRLWNATCNSDPRWDLEGSRIRRCAVNMLADLITNKIRPDEEKHRE